ncbi:MAG: histidine phosphatase family protein [Bacteroidota bacterium]
MTRLHLVRHLPALGAEGRAIGHTDLPLADPDAPARLASAWPLAPPDRIVASPLQRASHTAAALGAAWGLDIEHEPRLREVDFGRWDGRTWADIEHDDAEALGAWMADWTMTPAPGGESFADVQDRVRAWLAEQEGRAQDIVVVAHAGTIRAVLVHVLGLEAGHAFRLAVAHGALTTVHLQPALLVTLNQPL